MAALSQFVQTSASDTFKELLYFIDDGDIEQNKNLNDENFK